MVLAAFAIVYAGVMAYAKSFGGPFLFDDLLAIVENPTIQRFFTWEIFRPPAGHGLTVEGRPLLNASLALNYAISGVDVWSYHALNLAIHLAAALVLFGLVRRTVLRPGFAPALRTQAFGVAFVVALGWALHPLQTESVTYVVQRAESLMGLWVLLALYAFARGTEPEADQRWFAVAVAAALAGAWSKEVSAVIPVFALLYDRTFVAGSFAGAWRERRWVHVGLMSCWLPIGLLVFGSGSRGGTVGFGSNVAWHDYALTQFDALARYLGLTVWPYPLVFDYGTEWVRNVGAVLPAIAVVVGLVAGTLLAVWRWPAWGFLGLIFLGPLAPTSLIPGNRQTMAEHRLYLPLLAVVLTVVCGATLVLARQSRALRIGLATLAVTALGVLTWQRNALYQSAEALYADTVTKRPNNAYARYNLGKIYSEAGAPAEAVVQYREAVRLMPGLFVAHCNLGNALGQLGRLGEAEAAYRDALRLEPRHAMSHYNLGIALVQQGRKAEAKTHFRAALESNANFLEARENLGGVLLDLGELDAAQVEFETLLRQVPGVASVHFNLGAVHRAAGRTGEARREFERALVADPNLTPAREALQALR